MNSMKYGIAGLLAPEIKSMIRKQNLDENNLLELRLRVNEPIILLYNHGECYLKDDFSREYVVKKEDIKSTLDMVSNYSLYAYEHEMKQGYITVKGGHRIGFAGQVVMEDGRIKGVKHISFINIRVAHEIKGCGVRVLPYMINAGRVLNTLIVSPPGCGKTTLLRDIVRLVSSGNKFLDGLNVGVVDERSEIGACYMGVPQNDVGIRTDVLDGCPKADGMLMLLRSMNPKVIAVDEIGSRSDVDAISYVINCGCSIVATIHGTTIDDIRTRPILRKLVEQRVFERYIVLGSGNGVGSVDNIFDERGNELFMPLLSVAN